MYSVLMGLVIVYYFDEIRYNTHYYLFHLIAILSCSVAWVLIRKDWVMRRDKTMFALIFILNALTITKI